VIAKILMDFDLLQTDLGAVVISSAMFDDLVGWILFGIVLSMIGSGRSSGVARTISLVALFVTLTLTAGRWLIAKILRFLQVHTANFPSSASELPQARLIVLRTSGDRPSC
jgi:Kef-type K+ transport system membrane component KefB